MPAPVPLRQPWYAARPLLMCLGVFMAVLVLLPDLAASELVDRNLSVDQELLPANFDYEINDGIRCRCHHRPGGILFETGVPLPPLQPTKSAGVSHVD